MNIIALFVHVTICQDVPGGSAKNHLSQPALGIGALDQQVTLQRRCVRQDGLAGAATLGLDGDGLAQHPVAVKIAGELFAGRPRHGSTLHRQHDDMACFLEKRHCNGRRSRLFGAAIPCNQNFLTHVLRGRRRCNQDGTAGFE